MVDSGEVELMARMRLAGLRATSGRVAALTYLQAHPHSTAHDVHAAIAERLPSLSLQSVYNAVNDLTEKGLLRRVDVPGAALYETQTGDNHHHIRCVVCGAIEDVECDTGVAPCLTTPTPHDMPVILRADITFQAVCSACLATTAAPPGPGR